jgi:hypothetical protein
MKNQRTKEEMELLNLGLGLAMTNEKLTESIKQLVETNSKAIKGFCEEYEHNKGLRITCFEAFKFLNKKTELTEEEEELKAKMLIVLNDFVV